MCSDVFVGCFIHRKACEKKTGENSPFLLSDKKNKLKVGSIAHPLFGICWSDHFFARQDTWWAFQPTADHAKLRKRKWSNYAWFFEDEGALRAQKEGRPVQK